jgi:hypothetical protein
MPKPKKRKTMRVRPLEVTLPNGKRGLAQVSYPKSQLGPIPREGRDVSAEGREGGYYKRRIAEGALKIVEAKPAKTKKGGE